VVILSKNPKAKVNTFIAIPYNPYESKPYERWIMAGMLDLRNELKVAEEFLDFLAGKVSIKIYWIVLSALALSLEKKLITISKNIMEMELVNR
jgi:type II restriction enzyme